MPTPLPRNKCADSIAEDYVRLRSQLRAAAKILHDDAGSSLAAAGLQLQLLRMDFPQAEGQLAELVQSLEGAMQTVRQLIQELSPSPVRATGLKGALEDLAARHTEVSETQVVIRYTAAPGIPAEIGDSLYYLTELVLRAIPAKAERIRISVSGSRNVMVRIRANCELPQRSPLLSKVALLAKTFALDCAMDRRQVTMMTVKYAIRRSAG